MSVTAAHAKPHSPTAARASLVGLTAAVGSVAAVLIVAALGKAAGASSVQQLTAPVLSVLTVIGVAVGTVAWVLIIRRTTSPRWLLARLVPGVLVLSFVPDLLLGLGTTPWSAVVTLMCAHVAVFAVTIPILVAKLPLGRAGEDHQQGSPGRRAPRRGQGRRPARRSWFSSRYRLGR